MNADELYEKARRETDELLESARIVIETREDASHRTHEEKLLNESPDQAEGEKTFILVLERALALNCEVTLEGKDATLENAKAVLIEAINRLFSNYAMDALVLKLQSSAPERLDLAPHQRAGIELTLGEDDRRDWRKQFWLLDIVEGREFNEENSNSAAYRSWGREETEEEEEE